MTKRELVAKLGRTDEDRLLLARVLDKLDLARTRSVPAHTQFLSQGERALVEELINAAGRPSHLFFGGYEGAERTVCAFLPQWMEADDFLAAPPLAAVAIRPTDPANTLSHRDYLGAILGLGFTREKFGDLLVADGFCKAVMAEETAPLVLSQLDQVGRCTVKVSPLALSELKPVVGATALIRDTVSSLRLDAVVAAAFDLPRSKATALIEGGRVHLNHRECVKADRTVAEGDVLTCRGYGRCTLTKVVGTSRKGRTIVELEKTL